MISLIGLCLIPAAEALCAAAPRPLSAPVLLTRTDSPAAAPGPLKWGSVQRAPTEKGRSQGRGYCSKAVPRPPHGAGPQQEPAGAPVVLRGRLQVEGPQLRVGHSQVAVVTCLLAVE